MPGTRTDDDSDGGTTELRSGGDPSAIVNPRGAVGERNGQENGGSRTKGKTMSKRKKQVIRVKNSWGCRPPHSNYLGVFLSFKRTFAEVITPSEASTHEFYLNF